MRRTPARGRRCPKGRAQNPHPRQQSCGNDNASTWRGGCRVRMAHPLPGAPGYDPPRLPGPRTPKPGTRPRRVSAPRNGRCARGRRCRTSLAAWAHNGTPAPPCILPSSEGETATGGAARRFRASPHHYDMCNAPCGYAVLWFKPQDNLKTPDFPFKINTIYPFVLCLVQYLYKYRRYI